MAQFFKRYVDWDGFVAVLAALFCILLNYPGLAYYDTNMQLAYARSIALGHFHEVHDYQPLIMSLIMIPLDKLGIPLGGLLILHQALFWSGLVLLSRAFLPSRLLWRILGILLIGFFPPIFSISGGVLKDLAFSSSMVFLFGLAATQFTQMSQLKQPRLWIKVLFGFVFFYATNVRLNGFPALVPLIALLAYGCSDLRRRIKTILFWTAFAIISVVAHQLITYHLIHANRGYLVQQLFLHDLAGISLQVQENLIPPAFDPHGPGTLARLKKTYDPTSCMYLFALKDPQDLLQMSNDRAIIKDLKARWKHTLWSYPKEYLAHRSLVFEKLYGLGANPPCWPVFRGTGSPEFPIYLEKSSVRNFIFDRIEEAATTFLFKPYLYLLLNLVLIAISFASFWFWKKRDLLIVLIGTLGLSGLAYTIPSFFVTLGCDFRYHHWMLLATLLSGVGLSTRVAWFRKPSDNQATNERRQAIIDQ